MTIRNQVVPNFPQIAINDSNGNITGVNFNSLSNVSLGNVANLHILGGINTQVLSTDGTGNLSWVQGGVVANNLTFSNTNRNPAANYVSPYTAGNPIFFSGNVPNLQQSVPVGTQVRFRDGGPAYSVSNVARVTTPTAGYNIYLANNTTETISIFDTLYNTVSGVANNIFAGNGITFTPDAVNRTITVNSTGLANGTSNVNIPSPNDSVVFGVNGNANVMSISGTRAIISRGAGSPTSNVDEFLSLGGNSYSGSVVLGMNASGASDTGIRLSTGGTQRWFLGTGVDETAHDLLLVRDTRTISSYYDNTRTNGGGVFKRIAPLSTWSAIVSSGINSNTTVFPQLFTSSSYQSAGARGPSSPPSVVGVTRSTVSPYSITIDESGTYLIILQVSFSTNSSGYRRMSLSTDSTSNINAGVNLINVVTAGVAGTDVGLTGQFVGWLPQGDVYTVKLFQNSGANLSTGSAASPNILTIVRL